MALENNKPQTKKLWMDAKQAVIEMLNGHTITQDSDIFYRFHDSKVVVFKKTNASYFPVVEGFSISSSSDLYRLATDDELEN